MAKPWDPKLTVINGEKTLTLRAEVRHHELGAPPGRVPRAPPLTPRPAPPLFTDSLGRPVGATPTPWISKEHREGFFVGLVAGLMIGLGVCITTIAVLTR